jgi:Kef-type K+ transport system membrane component KefB
MVESAFSHVLLTLAAVILVGRLLAGFLRWCGQPPVIGEVLAGIALGPSVLGALGQRWFDLPAPRLLDVATEGHLAVIAELGIVLYMFLVGVEFNADAFRSLARTAAIVAAASLTIPFVLGLVVAPLLPGTLAGPGASPLAFALFLGVSLAVTAFPVLARILTDRGLARTELGVLALSCAAVGDMAAWWLLALVAGVVRSHASGVVGVVAWSLVYLAAMFIVVRPVAARLIARADGRQLGPTAVAIIFSALLLSALATDLIGIHAVFGAFLFGAIIPHDSHIAQSLKGGLEQVVLVLLLPAFFAYTGMRTEIGLVRGWENWLVCGLIIVVASLGKFGGTLGAARLAGLDWRTSASLGILMNTRGLMELIVLNIGLDLGVISPALFAMMVLMALVTTLATTPLVALVNTPLAAAASRHGGTAAVADRAARSPPPR